MRGVVILCTSRSKIKIGSFLSSLKLKVTVFTVGLCGFKMKKKFKIIDTSTGQKLKLREADQGHGILDSKQKALESLIQRIADGTALEHDIKNYAKLKKWGIIK